MNNRIYLNNHWLFVEEYEQSLHNADYTNEQATEVRLPHTCKELPFHYFDESLYQMVSGYRRVICPKEEWQGKVVLLTIDGAAHDSEVYLNGEKIGEHHCGYTAFTMDISKKLRYGEDNILVVKVDSRESVNIPPFGFVIDYMTYGGIYRDVYLDIKEPKYIADVYIHSKVKIGEKPQATMTADVTLNDMVEGCILRASIALKDDDKYLVLKEQPIAASEATMQAEVKDVQLWSPENPYLYDVKIELIQNGQVVDVKKIRTGFRRADFRKSGFYLNGEKYKIRGLNRHQSYPYVGYAMPKSMQEMDADVLKNELGLNAVRTSHYPQSHYFLDRCDEIGLLVFTEMPGWQHIGDADWKDQAVENVKDMVLQYRNHTSIILWGVRINESPDDDEFYIRTNDMAHDLDPYRPTGGVRCIAKSNLFEDVYTYNDFCHNGTNQGCEKKEKITSDMSKAYLISEYNGHMFPTKMYDCEEHIVEHAIRHARVINDVAEQGNITGSFGWCMADYNTHKDFGSGDRICYHGVLDMFRNGKLAADVYAIQQEEKPVLSLSSTMDIGEHPACVRGNTYIFTNADSVKMYKNDRFIKEYTQEHSEFKGLKHGPIIVDDFIGDAIIENEDFKPGQAQAVKDVLNLTARHGMANLPKEVYKLAAKLVLIYRMNPGVAVEYFQKYIGDWGGESTVYRFEAIKDGEVVKTVVKDVMRESHVSAMADHVELKEDHTYDVAAVRIQALDQNENVLRFYNDPVILQAEGPIEIIGPSVISLQGGMGGTYVKTTGEAGKATLTIEDTLGQTQIIEFNVTI